MFNYFDVSVLNPITWPRRIITNTVSALCDQDTGIWLGKKSLKNSGIGLTIAPGFDLLHWAIMIDGHLYEIAVDEKSVSKATGVYHHTTDKDCIKQFKWTRLIGDSIKTHDELIDKCERSTKAYSLVPYELGMVNDKMNCQQFVHMLYAYARGITVLKATCITNLVSGNIVI